MKKFKVPKKLLSNIVNNKVVLGVLVVLFLIAVFLFKKITAQGYINQLKTTTLPNVVKKLLNNPTAKFEIGSLKETNGVYEFELTLNSNQKFLSYLTKDGKILFTSGIKLDDLNQEQTATTNNQKKLTCNDLEKAAKPTLSAFVVADCPFGLQMQRLFKKVVAEQPQLNSYINIKYIGSVENGKITSMHGDKEAQENLRQICLREEQPSLYWNYLACYMQDGKSEECLSSVGVDNNKLANCTKESGSGVKYAKADFDLANKYKIGSSPTLLLNNKQTVSEFDFGGRVPNAIKEIVCCSTKEKPAFCQQTLSKEEVATSFSQTDAKATQADTTNSANCGN